MTIAYRIDKERRLLETVVSGVLRDADHKALWRAIMRDPEMELGVCRYELHDRLGVTRVEISNAYVSDFADRMSNRFDRDERLRGMRIATVASSDAMYGVARMSQMRRAGSPAEFGVFREMDAAREWLGLEEDASEAPFVEVEVQDGH